tara:strand:- start:3012 stop:4712 length:1701 start_codon:yes stop_codon:yes gene_type:complete
MTELMTYLLKSAGITVLFLCFYQFLLRRETFFTANRFFLLSGLLASLLLPLLTITRTVEALPASEYLRSVAPAETGSGAVRSFDWQTPLTLLYLIGCLVCSVRFLVQLLSLRKLIRSGKSVRQGNLIYVEAPKSTTPFSFFHYIVYPPDRFTPRELADVLAHERVHTSGGHSWDMVLVQVMAIFQWFNPFIWLYGRSVAENLEFMADGTTSKTDKVGYQYLMLRTSMGKQGFSLVNPFFNSFIKKRIVMLNKSRSNPVKAWKYAVIFPLLASFVLFFNTTEVVAQSPERASSDGTDLQLEINADATDAELHEQVSLFKERGVTLEFKNVTRNTDGKITGIESTYKGDKGQSGSYSVSGEEPISSFMVSISTEEGASHIRYSTQSVASTPATHIKIREAKSAHVAPKGSTKSITAINSTDSTSTTSSYIVERDGPSLYIIDDKEVSMTAAYSLAPDQIESIDVIKGETARESYGEAGKKGVVIVTTKQGKKGTSQNISVNTNTTVTLDTDGKTPLILIDGEEADQKQMNDLNPGDIESINVIKNRKQTKPYGKKGKNGVIKITTKKG